MGASNTRRIVLLGKTGAGKSSLANTIFGEELFKTGSSSKSETSKCQAENRSVNDRRITLIDTPGFFDTDRSEEEMKPEIVRCITECAPGPHAFLIVLKVERYTKQEEAVITEIRKYFSDEVFKYATVLFTHGDQLDEGQTTEDFIHQNKLLSDLVKKCGGRCHVIDNKYWKNNQQDDYRSNKFQVEELLKTIDKMIEENNESCYTNEMLQAVEAEIQQEVENIRRSAGNMPEEELREKAKGKVYNKFLIKLAGVGTGVLLGAFGSVAGGVEAVVKMLKRGGKRAKTAATAVAGGAGAVTAAKAAMVSATEWGLGVLKGAVMGGVAGYRAAEGAETPDEAAQKTAEAFMSGAKQLLDETLQDSHKKNSE